MDEKKTQFQTDACLNVFTVFFFNRQLYIHDQFRKIYIFRCNWLRATEETYD